MLSCSPDGPDGGTAAALKVTPESLVLDPAGGQEFISVTSSGDWLVRSDASWLKASPSSGKASGDAVRVSLTYDANTGTEARTAVLTVKTLKGEESRVSLSQDRFEGELPHRGISTAEDLLAFASAVNSGGSLTPFMENGSVVLLNDIDASSIKEWTPAGTESNPFTGIFDGRDRTISGISWTVDLAAYPDAGLFGRTKAAEIRSLKFGASGDSMTLNGDAAAVNAAAIAGRAEGGSISGCVSSVDIYYKGGASGENICVAGICGRYMAGAGSGVQKCSNRGNIYSPAVCRAAGFVAYNEAEVKECVNDGCILAEKSGEIGPAWGCSYNRTPQNFSGNTGRGHVGDYASFKDSPESADSDAYLNAVASPAREGYELESVTVDNTKDSYYDWTEVSSKQVSEGVKYTFYDCDNVPRKVHILEIDLSNPAVEVTTSYADDCVPNPNGNKNSNNGFNIRETLSQLCARKRSEGQNIVAGINSGFFDSNDGISRGFHIEEGRPVYINNPSVVSNLTNHVYALTIFTDGTASCGRKTFSGKLRTGGQEFAWRSLNDTILRHASSSYLVNLYDSHYVEHPHASKPSLVNRLADNVLYVVAQYDDVPMMVNCGYASAKVVSIADGRSAALDRLPYITSEKQVGIALSGRDADAFKALVSVGSTVELRCDMTIEGETTRPIYTQNSTMYHIMKDGSDNLFTVGSSSSLHTKQDPMTYPVISRDGKTLWLVEIDGRQGWYSTGVTGYEILRIAMKLGGWNVTRFDGGGSSAMWIYDAGAGKGGLVNSVSDSKGERSCLNYILIKAK